MIPMRALILKNAILIGAQSSDDRKYQRLDNALWKKHGAAVRVASKAPGRVEKLIRIARICGNTKRVLSQIPLFPS